MLWVKKRNFFSLFDFGQVRTRNKLSRCSREKRTFFTYNKTTVSTSQKLNFSKRVNLPAFSQKLDFFSLFVFSQKKKQEIRLNDVLDRKQTFF